VREAVNFAKSTNLLGVILEATTLVSAQARHPTRCLPAIDPKLISQAAVPSLVASVKDAGLLLAAFGDERDTTTLRSPGADGRMADALIMDG
jgi:CDK inhibitor PHO81